MEFLRPESLKFVSQKLQHVYKIFLLIKTRPWLLFLIVLLGYLLLPNKFVVSYLLTYLLTLLVAVVVKFMLFSFSILMMLLKECFLFTRLSPIA